MAAKILSILIGYGFGLIQTAFIYGKLHGSDIRKLGSGNAGTTNALRNYGTKTGIFVAVIDVLKCVIAILVCRALFAHGNIGAAKIIGLYAGLGATLGHNFPFYMDFKGGKGVACACAIALMFSVPAGLIAIAVFFAFVFLTRYVSLGSLSGVLTFFICSVVLVSVGRFGLRGSQRIEAVVLCFILLLLSFYQHRENIQRLLNHTERKINLRKKGHRHE